MQVQTVFKIKLVDMSVNYSGYGDVFDLSTLLHYLDGMSHAKP